MIKLLDTLILYQRIYFIEEFFLILSLQTESTVQLKIYSQYNEK